MATTSLWRIKGKLGKVIDYIENPEKTLTPFPERTINEYLERYCNRLGILYRSSHKLRKTAVSSLVNSGISLNAVRAFAGHVDEKTTLAYYTFDRENEATRNEQFEKALSFSSAN